MSEWQPIETAPKDGSRILLGNEREASFNKKPAPLLGGVTGRWDGEDWCLSAFFIVPGGRYGMVSSVPTHWKPLNSQDRSAE